MPLPQPGTVTASLNSIQRRTLAWAREVAVGGATLRDPVARAGEGKGAEGADAETPQAVLAVGVVAVADAENAGTTSWTSARNSGSA
jgi:hypothetical protein